MTVEIEAVIRVMQAGKNALFKYVSTELLKEGDEELMESLTKLCRNIWQTMAWPREWFQSLLLPLPKKGNSYNSRIAEQSDAFIS